jgi:hypothetical protein
VDRALRDRVVDQVGIAADAVDGAGVDYRRALAHVLERGHREPPRPVHVRLHRAVEDLGRDLLGRVDDGLRPVVVDQDVDPAELVDRALDRLPAGILLGEVARDQDAAPPLGLDQPLRVLGVVVLAQVGDRDIRALFRERGTHRAADPRVAAGHERDLAVELAGALVAAHLVPRLGRHLALVAWPLLLLWWEFFFV